MRKIAVHLPLMFNPKNKGVSINMQACRNGKHKAECRKLDNFLVRLKGKLIVTGGSPPGRVGFGNWKHLHLGILEQVLAGDSAEIPEEELPAIMNLHSIYFRESTNKDAN